ncbi:MAG: carboxypeptidase-like regulatory domain-containing protein [Thermofilaceae archaeon]
MRVEARAEVLQERVPKTYRFVPIQDYFYPAGGWCEQHNTEFCPEAGHEGLCIRWRAEWWYVFAGVGRYRLKVPINIRSEMPGSGHVLAFAKVKAMINVGWGTWIISNNRSFTVYADGNVAFKVEDEKIAQGDNAWIENRYLPKVDISNNERLDVELWSRLLVATGGFRTHMAEPMITIEYVPETPPEPATVRVYVYDRQTNRAVGGALVQLLSGSKIVAQGTTDRSGTVTFTNVPAGVEGVSYALKVVKSGYEVYEEAVEVKPGENSFLVALVPTPVSIPEWVKYAVVGGIVVVGGGVAMAALRRERIVVVK